MRRYWTDLTEPNQRSELQRTFTFSSLIYCSTSDKLVSLEDFVREHDHVVYGASFPQSSPIIEKPSSPLHVLKDLVNIHVVNSFNSLSELYANLDNLDLRNPEHLRPAWDTYFMVCLPPCFYIARSVIADYGFTGVAEVQLYETSSGSHPRT
jgi:hypothetical protein